MIVKGRTDDTACSFEFKSWRAESNVQNVSRAGDFGFLQKLWLEAVQDETELKEEKDFST